MPEMDLTNEILFCPRCFASENDSSWGEAVYKEMCANCGSPAPLTLPEWAVKSIREQASWVGKRYYPHDEDQEAYEERKHLLKLVKSFPRRKAEPARDEDGKVIKGEWEVTQETPGGSWISTTVKARTAEGAMKKCGLTYFPEESFK